MMRAFRRGLFALCLVATFTVPPPGGGAMAADAIVTDVRIGQHVDKTRFVLELTSGLDFNFFMLDSPYRVVLDFGELDWKHTPVPPVAGLLKAMRYGLYKPRQSRIVLEAHGPVAVNEAFYLAPGAAGTRRLVLDLVAVERSTFLAGLNIAVSVSANGSGYARANGNGSVVSTQQVPDTATVAPPSTEPIATSSIAAMNPKKKPAVVKRTKRIVAIDPGHGGADPGAIGRSGAYEKHITLAASRIFKEVLESSGRYTVVLTRDRDIFLPLRERVARGRNANAELFLSIHADSIKNRKISGASVYTLSEKASDKEAALLAEKENKADLIAGIDLSTESTEVTNILIDLAQRESMNQSAKFAGMLVKDLERSSKVLSRAHRFAGFAVLKAPDVPSVLVELGFLSNTRDEKNLRSKAYLRNIGKAILHATDEYFSQVQQANVY